MSPIRILIADDHDLVRTGLRLILQGMDGFAVVGEARDGREAISLARSLAPDVVLMDLMMPELNGLDATARLVAADPHAHVLILSMNAGEEWVLPALRAGAVGYLVKNVRPAELELAVRAASRGETYLCSAVSHHVVHRCLERSQAADGSFGSLTPRQREVLQLVAEGRTSKEIAARLNVSTRTAEAHRTKLMESLEIHDVAGLVRYAIRMGVVSP